MITNNNILLGLDVYKMGHMEQYAPGCTKVYSYLTARSDKNFKDIVFFGLQYYLLEYLTNNISHENVLEFLHYRSKILGIDNSYDIINKMEALSKLGYLPIEIKAVPEGTVMPIKNVIMTITNTHPDFHWIVGFIESLILKLWYPITVASCCYKYRKLVDKAFNNTVSNDMMFLKDFTVHDFGYRGDSSEEGAALSGAAHLLSFKGSDTVPSYAFIDEYYPEYPSEELIMSSVPASEHSVMCSFGRENELAAFQNMLNLYPTGIVSIVSDTFDVYRVLTEFASQLKDQILARDGKVVFRPDSGNPEYIICGDPNAPEGSNEWKGAIRLLDEMFGSTVNDKGYKVLNPQVGLIYGDGMYYERYERTLNKLAEMGYAASNLVIGVGGILRNHSRDTLGFAIKATHVVVNNESKDIEKDPITDHGKKSHKGLMYLIKNENEEFVTIDQCTSEEEKTGLLRTVFIDGYILQYDDFSTIRTRVQSTLK